MAKKKGIIINSMINDAKATEWGYMLDGKPVSEFKFMQALKREMRGEPVKKVFYWTDQKVIAAFKLLVGIKITSQVLNGIKKKLLVL